MMLSLLPITVYLQCQPQKKSHAMVESVLFLPRCFDATDTNTVPIWPIT